MLKIEVRNSHATDVDPVLAFLEANPHPNLINRDRDTIAQQVANRRFILIHGQSESLDPAPALLGVAGLFPHNRTLGPADGGAEPAWRELGATRIILNGFGLHKLAIAARVAHDLALTPGAEAQFSVLRDHDIGATATHITAGFSPWTPPPVLAQRWAQECSVMAKPDAHGLVGYQFLALPRVAAAQLIHFLLRCNAPDFMLIRPASRRHGAAQAAHLNLALDCLRTHHQELALLSQADAVYGRLQSVHALGERSSIL
jgi:hypothetical protein